MTPLGGKFSNILAIHDEVRFDKEDSDLARSW